MWCRRIYQACSDAQNMLDQAEQIQKDHEAHMQAAKAEMQTAKAEMLAAEEKMLAAKAEMLAAEEKMLAAKEEMQAGKADLQAANIMEAANTRYQTTVGLYKAAAGFYNEAVGTCGAKKKLYNEASEKSQEYMSNVAVCKSQVLKTTNCKISWCKFLNVYYNVLKLLYLYMQGLKMKLGMYSGEHHTWSYNFIP